MIIGGVVCGRPLVCSRDSQMDVAELSRRVLVDSVAVTSFWKRGIERKILLTIVKPDSERCLIDARADRTIAFLGDAVDAPTLCCGHCEAALVVGVDRRRLANMIIECKRCGC